MGQMGELSLTTPPAVDHGRAVNISHLADQPQGYDLACWSTKGPDPQTQG